MHPANKTVSSTTEWKSQYHPSFGSNAPDQATASYSAYLYAVSNESNVQTYGSWPSPPIDALDICHSQRSGSKRNCWRCLRCRLLSEVRFSPIERRKFPRQ